MSYCQKCGQYVDDSVAYCPNCGEANANYVAPYYAEPAPEPKNGLNVMAIVGMALSELGIPGIIVSSIAKKRADSGEYRTPLAPLAKAGLIVSIVFTVFWAIYFIAVIAMAGAALKY